MSDLKSHSIKPVVRQVFLVPVCVCVCVCVCPRVHFCVLLLFAVSWEVFRVERVTAPHSGRAARAVSDTLGVRRALQLKHKTVDTSPRAMWIKATRQGKSGLLREIVLRKTHFPAIGS